MTVYPGRMLENLELTHGALYSQRVLLALVEEGMSRDEAYRIAQRLAQQAWDERVPLRDLLAAARPELDLDAIFDPSHFTRYAEEIVGRLNAIV
jgi:adenylosuccinate lyase